jgi:pilus assembly protein CpaB
MGSRLMMVLAGVLAVGSVILLWYGTRLGREAPSVAEVVTQNEPRPPPAPPEADVVAAARDLPRGHLLVADDLTVTRVEGTGTGHYLDPQPLVGEITRVPVVAGALLEPAHLVRGGRVARSLFPGERAVAVQVDEVIGAGGFLQPEDYVDVLLYLKGRFEHVDQSQAQVVLRKVRVLALGDAVVEQPVADPPPDAVAEEPRAGVMEQAGEAVRGALPGDRAGAGTQSADERPARTPRTGARGDDDRDRQTGKRSRSAVLAVQEEDASRLMLAASAGDLRLAVLPTAEGAVAAPVPDEAQPAGLAPAALTREQARAAAEQEAARRRVVLDDLVGKQRRAASPGGGTPRRGATEQGPTLVIHRGDEAERVAVGR